MGWDLQGSSTTCQLSDGLAKLDLPDCPFRSERLPVSYTLHSKDSRVPQTSIYHFQYTHQLGTKKRKLILDKSPKQKFCFQHTFQTDFSPFSRSVHGTQGSYGCHAPLSLHTRLWEGSRPPVWLQWRTQQGWAGQAAAPWVRLEQHALRLEGLRSHSSFAINWLCNHCTNLHYSYILPSPTNK